MSIWLNDDDPESTNQNWKNSEIMKDFATLYFNNLTEQEEQRDNEVPVVTSKLELETEKISTEDVANAYLTRQANEQLDHVIETLGDLAQESTKYGNETATYMIERTLEDIRAFKGGE